MVGRPLYVFTDEEYNLFREALYFYSDESSPHNQTLYEDILSDSRYTHFKTFKKFQLRRLADRIRTKDAKNEARRIAREAGMRAKQLAKQIQAPPPIAIVGGSQEQQGVAAPSALLLTTVMM